MVSFDRLWESENVKFGTFIVGIFLVGATLAAVAFLRLYQVRGESMLPGLTDGAYVILNTRIPDTYKRGKVIIYQGSGQAIAGVKRVIGVPGDIITIQDKKVYIGEDPVDEPYLPFGMETCIPTDCSSTESTSFTVPEGSYFVMGDNRKVSNDSRNCHGDILCKDAKGKYIQHESITGNILFSLPSWASSWLISQSESPASTSSQDGEGF